MIDDIVLWNVNVMLYVIEMLVIWVWNCFVFCMGILFINEDYWCFFVICLGRLKLFILVLMLI